MDRRASNRELEDAYDAIVASFGGANPVSADPARAELPVSAPPGNGKDQLNSAYAGLVAHEAAKAIPVVPPRHRPIRLIVQCAVIAASIAAIAYLWVGRPRWLYPDFEPVPSAAGAVEAEQVLVAAGLMVDQFQGAFGRLPRDWNDIGVDFLGVAIVDHGNGQYELNTVAGTKVYRLLGAPGQESTLVGPNE